MVMFAADAPETGLRRAAVAGKFYPADAATLRNDLRRYLDEAERTVKAAPDRVAALIGPHAGYVYSGLCAAHAYARAHGKVPGRIVLLGRSHRMRFHGISVWPQGAFETPLGRTPVDAAFARAVAEAFGGASAHAHDHEHALEVHLPFIQTVFPEAVLVPVLFGEEPGKTAVSLGNWLADRLDNDDLVITSTDLSHFLSEPEANAIDRNTLACVAGGDLAAFMRGIAAGACSMCGATAVTCAMAFAQARGATQCRILDYRTSARVTGDTSSVVGYGALSLEYAA
jgi:AmmeMemoRadiSam system protein B